jgi:hypothetical protein
VRGSSLALGIEDASDKVEHLADRVFVWRPVVVVPLVIAANLGQPRIVPFREQQPAAPKIQKFLGQLQKACGRGLRGIQS